MEDIFVARQPIYNRTMDVAGYELLFRETSLVSANITDGARASSRLIINTFMSIGLENIVGSSPAFINMTGDFFLEDQPVPMTQEQVVLEVPQKILFDPLIAKGVMELSSAGYEISIDDFVYTDDILPLLKVAHYVKLDLGLLSPEQMSEQVKLCADYDVKVMAKRVETLKELDFCRNIGIDYYQGYFFCKPDIIKGKIDNSNRAVLLNIVKELQDSDADMESMANVITQDVGLSYKLLRYINCAAYALRREIDTVNEALTLIGTEAVKKWAILILMSNYNNDKPQELSTLAMVRASMCERLAEKLPSINPHQAFTTGLFSTLDAVMDMPMEELLDTISLSSPIKFALLDYEGELGELLRQVISYEKGEWDELNSEQLHHADYSESYLAAVQWANENRMLIRG